MKRQTNKTFFHQRAPEEVPPRGRDNLAAGPFPSPKMFVLAATKSPWLPRSPAQVWAALLSAPLLQSSDRLEFSKNNLTENQRNEQREHKQLNNRSACPVRVRNPKTTKVPPPLGWPGLGSSPPTPCPCQTRPSQVKFSAHPPQHRSLQARQRWVREKAGDHSAASS